MLGRWRWQAVELRTRPRGGCGEKTPARVLLKNSKKLLPLDKTKFICAVSFRIKCDMGESCLRTSALLILNYIEGNTPLCPRGGTYSFNAVGTPPICDKDKDILKRLDPKTPLNDQTSEMPNCGILFVMVVCAIVTITAVIPCGIVLFFLLSKVFKRK